VELHGADVLNSLPADLHGFEFPPPAGFIGCWDQCRMSCISPQASDVTASVNKDFESHVAVIFQLWRQRRKLGLNLFDGQVPELFGSEDHSLPCPVAQQIGMVAGAVLSQLRKGTSGLTEYQRDPEWFAEPNGNLPFFGSESSGAKIQELSATSDTPSVSAPARAFADPRPYRPASSSRVRNPASTPAHRSDRNPRTARRTCSGSSRR